MSLTFCSCLRYHSSSLCLNFPCKRPCPDGLGLAGFCAENTIYQRDRREEQCDAARAATGSEKISKAARHPSVCVCVCMVNSMLFATSLLFMRCSPKGLFSPSLPHPAYPLNIVHTREVLIHVNRDRTKGMQMLLIQAGPNRQAGSNFLQS